MTGAPAFRVQATVEQDGQEWTSGLLTYMQVADEDMAIDLDVEHFPNFDQPYNVELTYYDAIGTGYRTQRLGYLNAVDFRLEEWDDNKKVWVNLV